MLDQSQASTSQASGSQTMTEDPAASLRAAALLTLKSKRQKAATNSERPAGLPARPDFNPSASIQLDYGLEDSFPHLARRASTSPVPAPLSQSATVPMDVDSTTREEGEISDSEDAPVSATKLKIEPLPKPTPTIPLPPKPSTLDNSSSLDAMPPPPPIPSLRRGNALAKRASPAHTSPVKLDTPTLSSQSGSSDTPFSLPEESRTRPGLALTEEQYEQIKESVLDVLGWGVPPEYLVDCGISSTVIYYVFSELNLRLPDNLNPHELQPVLSALDIDPVSVFHTVKLPHSPSFVSPSAPAHDQPISPSTARRPPPAANAVIPIDPVSPSRGPSLEDIEQQRRKELLARKAVLASRKMKRTSTEAEVAIPDPLDKGVAGGRSSVPNETVDSFLMSIDHVNDLTTKEIVEEVAATRASMDPMDVDDSPPGLIETPLHLTSSSSYLVNVPTARTPGTGFSDAQLSTMSAVDTGSSSITRQPSRSRSPSEGDMRRGTKRPVASDFVDMDHPLAPRAPRPHNRRKTTGTFAGVSGMRRVVINLSDSEDDENPASQFAPLARTGSLQSSKLNISRPPSSQQFVSPAALHEKEEEIRRMRELIAQKQNQLKKQVNPSTSSSTTPSTLSVHSTKIKEEVEDPPTIPWSARSPTPLDSIQRNSSISSVENSVPPSVSDSPTTPIDLNDDASLKSDVTVEIVSTCNSPVAKISSPVIPYVSSPPYSEYLREKLVPQDPNSYPPVDRSLERYGFVSYDSLLSQYPLLRSNLPYSSDTPSRALSPTDASSVAQQSCDWNPNLLRSASVARWIDDPARRICQYELPGGGVCRDSGCVDIHLSELSEAVLSDSEIARYLYDTFKQIKGPRLEDIESALVEVRRDHPNMNTYEHVAQVIATLGLR